MGIPTDLLDVKMSYVIREAVKYYNKELQTVIEPDNFSLQILILDQFLQNMILQFVS